jgi:hypothetical protein
LESAVVVTASLSRVGHGSGMYKAK